MYNSVGVGWYTAVNTKEVQTQKQSTNSTYNVQTITQALDNGRKMKICKTSDK